jgi:DMSO reductase family type II enzyme heme b subunit
VTDPLPRDPAAAAWKALAGTPLSLEPQRMIEPRLERDPALTLVELRTMHNGNEIGFHVTWEDPNRSDLEVAGHFRDSVAVQIPVTPAGSTFAVMGQPGRPVHLLHWRASWQRAIEQGFGTIRDVFPNAVSDVSPEDVMNAELAQRFYPAQVAGNAMAIRERTSAVEELVAEGFGTITSQGEQRAEGTGVFSGSRWEVVMVVPMDGKENQASLVPGGRTSVAVAVWNGGKGDRGARKQFASWSGLELEA